MSERFAVKEGRDIYFVIDTFVDDSVNTYDNLDDAEFDAKCRNEDEDEYGEE